MTIKNTVQEKQSFSQFLSSLSLWWFFLAMCLGYVGIILLRNNFVLTADVYYRGWENQLTAERIESFLEMRDRLWWLPLTSPVLIVTLKAGFTALCLTIGIIIGGQDIRYGQVFKVALFAEGVFVLQMLVQVLCGIFYYTVRVPADYADFAPLSLFQFFDPASLKHWMNHAIRTVNLFEVAYCLVLAYFLTPLLNNSRNDSESKQRNNRSFGSTLALVVSSYGTGLLLWMVLIAFLLLQVS